MDRNAVLDIKVVFDASNRRRKSSGRSTHAVSPRARSRSGLLRTAFAISSLAVAAGLYYATWWYADRSLIYITLMMKSPVVEVDQEALTRIFAPGAESPPPNADDRSAANAVTEAPPRYTGQQAATIMAVAAYVWLTISTLSFTAVAFAGASLLGARSLRRGYAFLAFIVFLLASATWMYFIWRKYQWMFPVSNLRLAIAFIAAAAALLGLSLGRAPVFFCRFAGLTTILAAAAGPVGLYFWIQCDAVSPAKFTASVLVLLFALHSLWGWVLLLARRHWIL